MKTAGRRQSKNVQDARGHARTTEKRDRLHPMGAKFLSGLNKRIKESSQKPKGR
jgi:hypothetical protein